MNANLHETLNVTQINLRHWFVTFNATLGLKCPNQQYLNTYPHSSATLHNKHTCYVIICMNSKTVECLETYMKLFHILVVVVMRINKSDNDQNRVTGTIPKSYMKIS